MLFNSGEFLVFFPIVILVYYICPRKAKNAWLLIASYYFYMCWNAKYALLLLASTLITYIGGIVLEHVKRCNWSSRKHIIIGRLVLVSALFANLFILFYFKYINFAIHLAEFAARILRINLNIPQFDIILPVGISFYTFQALGYLIDVYRDKIPAEKNPLKYALFVSFFPQLVAGPIERTDHLLRQFDKPQKFNVQCVRDGLLLMLWGFFLKLVIADRCALLVNVVYDAYLHCKGYQFVIANVLFAIQIYCDFMGYSVIAKGAAKVLGIDLMDNFAQPYFSESIKEFWRRWHISLSSWFRDYVYIPLGGSRCSKLRKYFNLLLTFAISGLWHGAGMTYVFWGIIHGLYLVIEDLLSPVFTTIWRKHNVNVTSFSWKFLKGLKTFIMVDIAWIFFRASNMSSALYILRSSFDTSNLGLLLNDGIYQLGLNTRNMNILIIALICLLIASLMRKRGIIIPIWLSSQNIAFRYMVYWGAIILIILSLDISGKEFIYFQF